MFSDEDESDEADNDQDEDYKQPATIIEDSEEYDDDDEGDEAEEQTKIPTIKQSLAELEPKPGTSGYKKSSGKKKQREEKETPQTSNEPSPEETPSKKKKSRAGWTAQKEELLIHMWEESPHMYDYTHEKYKKTDLRIATLRKWATRLDMSCMYLSYFDQF